MKFFNEFSDAFKALGRHKFRAILSSLGIILGSSSLIAMLSIGEGAKNQTLRSIENLGIDSVIIKNKAAEAKNMETFQKDYRKSLLIDDYLALEENFPNIGIAALKEKEGSIQSFDGELPVNILAVSSNYDFLRHLKFAKGRFFSETNVKFQNLVCVLGAGLSKQLGMLGQIGSNVLIAGASFEVIGVLEDRFSDNEKAPIEVRNLDQSVFIPIGTENHLRFKFPQRSVSEISEIYLKVRDKKLIHQIADLAGRIINKSSNYPKEVDVILPIELLNQAERSQRTFNLVLGGVAGMALLVGGVGIMNIMLATVAERVREIGIRRAFGATRKDILKQFLSEALILTLTGGGIGIFSGILLAFFIGYFSSWPTIVPFWSISLALAMSLIVGLAAGVYPANKAALVEPIQALKAELLRK